MLGFEAAWDVLGGAFEGGEADAEALGIGVVGGPSRFENRRAVKPLEPFTQHRPVMRITEPFRDVHNSVRIDAEEIAVVRQVMNRA